MRIDKAMAVVAGMGSPRRRGQQRRVKSSPAYSWPAAVPDAPASRWAWETATPLERAKAVRGHCKIHSLTTEVICDLFNLTPHGLIEILRGKDWAPEYQRS